MKKISFLDCTLRDGGYVNNWAFGRKCISAVIRSLCECGVEFIECGYMLNGDYDEGSSLFNDISSVNQILPKNKNQKFLCMIDVGKYDVNQIPEKQTGKVHGFRLAFKNDKTDEALKDAEILRKKGYIVFLNTVNTKAFKDEEIIYLCRQADSIKPYAITVSDSFGNMTTDELVRIFNLINKNLNSTISFCFHSHNNLGFSFSSAVRLIECAKEREVIIDAAMSGMGRGAGNLSVEKILEYYNSHIEDKYNINPVVRCAECMISDIYKPLSKDYIYIYGLCAQYNCHPNYARYFIEKNIKLSKVKELVKHIPKDKKSNFDEGFVQDLVHKTLHM